MRAMIKNCVGAARHDRRASVSGFSIVELLVVVATLGVLVAIAIPLFSALQANARLGDARVAATDGASQVVAAVADGTPAVAGTVLENLTTGKLTVTNELPATEPDQVCVSAVTHGYEDATWFAGPGATADGSACK
ncbi:hypothetical protein [Microbacterium pumilum]|uniref:Prepilin-type N-terminal cleavage/methylation domain-containing protein n=1 Tax=Microbacterium pumilum TaxID=344165 RepID=A0ABP5E098_9MICO